MHPALRERGRAVPQPHSPPPPPKERISAPPPVIAAKKVSFYCQTDENHTYNHNARALALFQIRIYSVIRFMVPIYGTLNLD